MSFPKKVDIRDDTMREGLQIESKDIPVSEKLRLLDAIGEMVPRGATVSVGSFAHPKWTPQMACIDEIVEKFVPKPGITYTAAVFNPVGFQRADKYYPKINVRIMEYQTSVYLSDTFARRNFNRTQEQQIAEMDLVIQRARKAGVKAGKVGIGAPWGCNFEGEYTQEQLIKMVDKCIQRWHEAGLPVEAVSFQDAMGWNMPEKVKESISIIRDKYPEVKDFYMHLHNQRGQAIISCYEALKLGVTHFDTDLGGMGGCPYCGNGRMAGFVPTEDFVYLCEEMGIATGYNLDALIEAAVIAEEVVGHQLWGKVAKAGPMPRGNKLYPRTMPLVETAEQAAHFRKGPSVYANGIYPWKEGDPLLAM